MNTLTPVTAKYGGTVVVANLSNMKYCVGIQTGSNVCILYKNLDKLDVKLGQTVSSNNLIGYTYYKCIIEYATSKVSNWPVRIGQNLWYKTTDITDLSSYLEEPRSVKLFSSTNTMETPEYPNEDYNIVTNLTNFILSNNKG